MERLRDGSWKRQYESKHERAKAAGVMHVSLIIPCDIVPISHGSC